MTATPETNILATLTTIDQNTGAAITWKIEHVHEVGPNVGRYGWTHSLVVKRATRGRKFYIMWVEMVGDVVVRNSEPQVAY